MFCFGCEANLASRFHFPKKSKTELRCLHSRSPHLILRRVRLLFFREVQDFRQWCKSKALLLSKPTLDWKSCSTYDDSNGAECSVNYWEVKPQTEVCNVGGEVNEAKVANKTLHS